MQQQRGAVREAAEQGDRADAKVLARLESVARLAIRAQGLERTQRLVSSALYAPSAGAYQGGAKLSRVAAKEKTQTQLSVETYRSLKAQLTKSKEQYVGISCELDKHNQLFEYNQNHSPNSTPVQQLALSIQKLEKKFLQAQEEYRQVVDKYNMARADYEVRFVKSSQVFQMQEETHLEQMRRFVLTYTQLVAQLNSSRQKNFNDCQQKLNTDYSNEILLQLLIAAKSTGRERPQDVEFMAHMLGNFNNSSFSTINSNSELNLTTTTRNTQSPTTTRVFDFHDVKREFVSESRSMGKNKSHENLSSGVAQELNNTAKSNGLDFRDLL